MDSNPDGTASMRSPVDEDTSRVPPVMLSAFVRMAMFILTGDPAISAVEGGKNTSTVTLLRVGPKLSPRRPSVGPRDRVRRRLPTSTQMRSKTKSPPHVTMPENKIVLLGPGCTSTHSISIPIERALSCVDRRLSVATPSSPADVSSATALSWADTPDKTGEAGANAADDADMAAADAIKGGGRVLSSVSARTREGDTDTSLGRRLAGPRDILSSMPAGPAADMTLLTSRRASARPARSHTSDPGSSESTAISISIASPMSKRAMRPASSAVIFVVDAAAIVVAVVVVVAPSIPPADPSSTVVAI
eukprot:Opistho-2@85676